MTFGRFLLVSTALFTALAAQAQESTVSISTPAPAVGMSVIETTTAPAEFTPWGVSFYNLSTAPMNKVGEGASIFAYNYLALNYKFSKTRRVSVRPVFQYTSAGQDNFGRDAKAAMVLGDAHLVYADYEIATLGAANVSTSFKFYLPTSDGSQANGMLLKFRPETFISLSVGRVDTLTYVLKPDIYFQSRASNVDAKKNENMTNIFVLEHYLEYGISLDKTFTLKPTLGFYDTWTNPSDNPKVTTRKTDAKLALALDIAAMKGLNFTLSAENRFAVVNRRDDVAVSRPEENSILLITNAAL